MKYLFQLLWVFLFFFSGFSAQQPEELFEEANRLYRLNQYEESIEIYSRLVDNGYESEALFYNLGNAYFRLGKIGYSILYYEKALRLSPSDEDIIHNLTLAQNETIDKVEELPEFFLFDWWESLLSSLSISVWTILSYVLFITSLIFFTIYFFTKNPSTQRTSFYAAVIVTSLFIFSAAITAVKVNRELNYTEGIIISHSVDVKNSPDESSGKAFIVHEGLKLIIEDELDNWVRIKLSDGKTGWVDEKNVGEI